MYSGGIGSFIAAHRVKEKHGLNNLTLLFTDTLMEDSDLYRFLVEGACLIYNVPMTLDLSWLNEHDSWSQEYLTKRAVRLKELRVQLLEVLPNFVWLLDGRNPWEVFFSERFLGSSQKDICSRTLKRVLAKKYVKANYDPRDIMIYLGHSWEEKHRIIKAENSWAPYTIECPGAWMPYFLEPDREEWLKSIGIRIPYLYTLGFAHNNCGGFCVRAGQGHFKNLLEQLPDRYDFHMEMEDQFRSNINKDVTIMRHNLKKVRSNLTMAELKQKVTDNDLTELEVLDTGGCGCFTG